MEKTKAKRSVSLFLALVLLIALLPGAAFTLPAQAETDPLIGDDEVVEELRYENTRLGMATLLYHMAGEPAVDTVILNDYTDLADYSDYERSAIAYVLKEEITTGTSPTTFGPEYPCTRGQAATFLWRAAGSPEPILAECPYTDVKAGAFYYKAICWTLEKQGSLDFSCEGLSFNPNGVFFGYQLFKVASGNPWRLRILMKAPLVTGECGENLTWTFDPNTGTLTLEGSGAMETYASETEVPWHEYFEAITNAVLPEGLTSINHMFCGSTQLPGVALPASLTGIGDDTFRGCTALTELTIPAGVTSIGGGAFAGCESLATLTLPEGLTRIAPETFRDCSALRTLAIPDGVTSVGDRAFYHTRLETVDLPASVNEVGESAFGFCDALNTVKVLNPACRIADPEDTLGSPAHTTIYGLADSTAKTYAEKYSYSFVALSPCDFGNHNYVLVDSKPHTDTEPGWNRYRCTECGSEYDEAIPAGHNWSGTFTLWYEDQTCSVCGATQHVDHSTALVLDEEISVPMPDGTDSVWFRFTPEISADYVLEDLSGANLFGEVYTAEGEEFGETGIAGGYGIFGFQVSLEAGQTYYFRAQDFYGTQPETVCVRLTRYEAPVSGSCGDGLNWYYDEEEHSLTIVGTGEMYDYSDMPMFEAPWKDHRENIYRIILAKGLTNVGSCAFCGCDNAEYVELPGTVTTVGEYAFVGCDALADVYYDGDAAAWTEISVDAYGNEALTAARIHWNTASEADHWSQVSTAPTCTEEGVEGEACSCGYTRNAVVTPALGHDFVDGVCTRCGKEQEASDIFTDLKPGAFYTEAVNWAVKNNVTSGTSATTFSPNNTCTRGQVVTFLWRAYGEPEPTTTTHSFTDVKESAFYYKAMLWAVEKGITTGTTATTFGPNKDCTRGQVVTFLWRAAGQPEPKNTSCPFADVKANASYYKAILWAVENGITTGTSATTFSPGRTCNRGQVVTFLYRAVAE